MCQELWQASTAHMRGLAPLTEAVEALSARQDRVIVALEGRCASGKTTLAAGLEKRCGWSVVHMDHFFPRPEQRTLERYARPGANVDHERFLEEVLLPLRRGERPVYRPFDCRTQTLLEPISFEPGQVVLVEGSYSCHPALWEHYDLRAFLTIDPVLQMERVAAREGEERARAFRERWIPLEEKYFSAYEVERRCEFRLEG
ncbi:MAG: uridine kinase [Oscillospiraceae bacterium]|nr:uridine kinase [Oscillospiraceae bacterium]